jgi:signal transduction histidine kinase
VERLDVEELRERLDQLRIEIAELRASRTRLVLAADASRQNIEHELHDGVQQHLVALAVKLQLGAEELNDDPSAAGLLEEIARDVQEAIDEAARLARGIHPPGLESGGGLVAALRAWASSAGIGATIEVRMDTTNAPKAAGAIYFCCLGALELVGTGGPVTITVHDDDGALAFEVVGEDSGASLASGAETSLRDRVDALGGHVVFERGPGGTTRVSGSMPV